MMLALHDVREIYCEEVYTLSILEASNRELEEETKQTEPQLGNTMLKKAEGDCNRMKMKPQKM